jgi:hypothetical protein
VGGLAAQKIFRDEFSASPLRRVGQALSVALPILGVSSL